MHSHSALGLFLPARAKRGSAETAAGAVRATRTSSRMLKSISSAVSAHPPHKTTATCHKTCVRHAKACSSYQKKHVKYSRANLKGANFSSFWAHESLSLTGETKPTGYLPFGRYGEVGCPLFHQLPTGLAHQCTEVLGTPVHWLAFLARQSFLSSLARLTRFWFPPAPGPTGHQSGYWFTRLVLHQFTGCGAPVWLLVHQAGLWTGLGAAWP